MTTVDRVIAEASKWVGYLEKKSNANLDDFTKNAGSNNYTRFNRDYVAAMKSGSINMQWCAAFVSCVFMYVFGFQAAKKILCGNLHCYTPTGANYFKKKGRYIKRGQAKPKPGYVIYFYSTSKGRIGHVGIVYKVDGSKVYTIEGNTSGSSSLVTNGGAVWKKSYSLSSTYIDGYGAPLYEDVSDEDIKPFALGDRLLRKGDSGPDVGELQTILLNLDYDLGKWGADGDFGSATESAVKAFQKKYSLEVDGIVGPATLLMLRQNAPAENGGAVTPEPEPEQTEPVKPIQDGDVEITGGSVYIRTGPGVDFDKSGVAYRGEKYKSVDTTGWVAINIDGGVRWISAKYVTK